MSRTSATRALAILVLAAMATAAVAPYAEARHKKRVRHHAPVVQVSVVRPGYPAFRVHSAAGCFPHSVYTIRRSHSGPVVASFLGGLFLGATLANHPPAGTVYWDPYCHRGFVSLEIYSVHARRYHHPHVVRVVERDYDGHRHDWHESWDEDWEDD